MKGHFGLGYTLVKQDRAAEAYGHLELYTWINPRDAWAWHWFGQCCAALGETQQAIAAFRRSLAATAEGSYETDADERIEGLEG